MTTGRSRLDAIHDAIQQTLERPLYDWVAVAIWDSADGDVSVFGESEPLELKGLLHSGVWAVAHEEGPVAPVTEAFDSAADVRRFEGGRMDVVKIGGMSIGRGVFEPGWKWSESLAPIIGKSTCPLSHVGFVVSGGMHFVMDDGSEFDISEGQAIQIAPGHDAWTVGDEPCVILEIQSAEVYARRAEEREAEVATAADASDDGRAAGTA